MLSSRMCRPTCFSASCGRLGDISHFEPTKSGGTSSTPKIRKTSADTRKCMVEPVELDCNSRWGYFLILGFFPGQVSEPKSHCNQSFSTSGNRWSSWGRWDLNPRLLASRLSHAGTPAPQVHRQVWLVGHVSRSYLFALSSFFA